MTAASNFITGCVKSSGNIHEWKLIIKKEKGKREKKIGKRKKERN